MSENVFEILSEVEQPQNNFHFYIKCCEMYWIDVNAVEK